MKLYVYALTETIELFDAHSVSSRSGTCEEIEDSWSGQMLMKGSGSLF